MFEQWLVHEAADVIVTFVEHTQLTHEVRAGETIILEPGAPAVWFSFPGKWYDIGRFHLRDGTFTGLYANLLTPIEFIDRLSWKTTDLFLDVWLGHDDGFEVLDADELEAAVDQGIVDGETARAAHAQVAALRSAWEAGNWPPRIVGEWTLARAVEEVRKRGSEEEWKGEE